ncbi:MAG: hypothetical protein RI988_3102 [Pseudomonadota bacterium]
MSADRHDPVGALDHLEDVAEAWLDLARRQAGAGHWEAALRAAHVGARLWSSQSRRLAWPALEAWLAEAAAAVRTARVDPHAAMPAARAGSGSDSVCLHVLTEALDAGGHSAMAWRWMRLDRRHAVQHVALLAQPQPVPDALVQAARSRGGAVHQPPAGSGFVEQALWLRALAYGLADCVVLHVDVADVVCGAAFGIEGGPPVLLVNHAAHVGATGAGFADAIADVRGSWLEQTWTAVHRGARRHAPVPIPLEEAPPHPDGPQAARTVARQALGISGSAPVALTLGAHFKFSAVDGVDFVATWERILAADPRAVLVAAGFAPDARWRAAAARCNGRIVMPGVVPRAGVAARHAAADLYADGFPFGTTTALLEAALAGLPAVLPPLPCRPPLATDGLAVDGELERPADEAAYVRHVLALLRDTPARERLGRALQQAVRTHHTAPGWQQHLDAALAQLPPRHAPLPPRAPLPTEAEAYRRWTTAAQAWTSGPGACVDRGLLQAVELGLGPELAHWLTPAVQASCRRHAALRRGQAIPLPVLQAFAHPASGWPALARAHPDAAARVLRAASFIARAGLPRRLAQRVAHSLGWAERARGAYDDYRPGSPAWTPAPDPRASR